MFALIGGISAVLCGGVGTPVAVAGDNDLVMSRLSEGAGADDADFRTLVSELGVVLAPRLAAPSDTLGFGGFQFAADLGFTSIASDQSHWRVLAGSPDPAGAGGQDHGGGLMPTLGLFMRKGIWLPLPSFEIGAGAVHLMGSRIWAPQAYAKFALHEGYHDIPLPSLAVRGAGARMMGSRDLDLTIASIDVSMSKSFGVGGTVNIAPYLGWNHLIIIARSEVLDPTPTDFMDVDANFVIGQQDDVTRTRYFGGVKLKHYVFALLVEYALTTAGSSEDGPTGITDQAASQHTVTVSLGMDF